MKKSLFLLVGLNLLMVLFIGAELKVQDHTGITESTPSMAGMQTICIETPININGRLHSEAIKAVAKANEQLKRNKNLLAFIVPITEMGQQDINEDDFLSSISMAVHSVKGAFDIELRDTAQDTNDPEKGARIIVVENDVVDLEKCVAASNVNKFSIYCHLIVCDLEFYRMNKQWI